MTAFPEIEEEFEAKKLAAKKAAALELIDTIDGATFCTAEERLDIVSNFIAGGRAHLAKFEYLEELLVMDLPVLKRDEAMNKIHRSRVKVCCEDALDIRCIHQNY